MDTASVSRSPSLQEWDVPVRSFGLRLKPLFSVCLFLKAAVHRPPPSQIPPRIEMDDMSDKGNRFQHFVIRQRKKLEHQMRRSLHLTLRKGRDANREMRRDGFKKIEEIKRQVERKRYHQRPGIVVFLNCMLSNYMNHV